MDEERWSQRGWALGDPDMRLLATRERRENLPPLLQYRLQARIRRARFNLNMRKGQLNAAIRRLEEFDQFLASLEGNGGDEPLAPYVNVTDSRPEDLSKDEQRSILHSAFDELIARGADKDWTKTDEGLRVPTARAVNAILRDLGHRSLSAEEVRQAYISYLNGEQ
jgi:hypothetical protein